VEPPLPPHQPHMLLPVLRVAQPIKPQLQLAQQRLLQ
jgi:hypothetical protein